METTVNCPSFIDLRAFADQCATAPGKDPFGADRRLLPLRGGPVEAGSIDLPAGLGTVPGSAGDCWLIVAKGAVALDGLWLAAGDNCVIRGNTAFAWSAEAPATLIFVRHMSGAAETAGIVPIDTKVELTPSGAPLAELLVGDTPACRNHSTFRSDDGEFTCGVWDSTPYYRRAMFYRHFELMYLLEGSVTFVDGVGREQTFSKDDIFLVEQGAECSWESRDHVAKVYAIYRPLD